MVSLQIRTGRSRPFFIFNETHLRHVLSYYFRYYHRDTTHLSLNKDCPDPRRIQPPSAGKIVAFPEVGGLHHRYERRAP
jgi:putative transposase